ncbi:hypothetical protein T12_4713 [Trichinella patagoniensis]|uniref:MSP domain-containing protein n=1 Tax=Trichinella patagoniensis TaxID=990121 RepID=A0A0V0ZXP1_9BILA|nr:hypothetical protein T12_4713 [Trichinella patagoniensis]
MDEEVVETIPDKEMVIVGQRSQTVQAELTIKNICENRLAYKIRCSSFKISISPKIGILEPEQSCKITLTRNPLQNVESAKLLIMTLKIDNSQTNPTMVWATSEKLPYRKRLKITLEDE